MRSRRRLPWYKQIWWENIYENYKKAFSYFLFIICCLTLLILGGIKLHNYIKECQELDAYCEELFAKMDAEKAEREAKRKAEYESWKNNPNNALQISLRQAEYRKAQKEELKKRSENYYKVGDKIVIENPEVLIKYGDSYIPDRIGVDVVRGFTEGGNIIGDKGTYGRDYIRKPTSDSEYRELVYMKLSGKLASPSDFFRG